MRPKLRVAFCGTRGLPANYGGFETAVDEITKRLILDDVECYVFCREHRANEQKDEFEGRKLLYTKGSKSRKLDTFVSSIQTGLFLLKHRKDFDYVLWFNNANLFGILLTLAARIPTAVNTDGLEWRRAKWSLPFKAFYFFSSMLISMLCRNLISDSISIQSYYRKMFKKKTQFIPYGAPKKVEYSEVTKEEVLRKYGLEEDKYFLQITRFEPDNLPLDIIKAFQRSGLYEDGFKHVLIGYKDPTPYAEEIKAEHNNNGVQVLAANYNHLELSILREAAFGYVHGNSVGGTNPALLEAMSSCKRILAIDGPFSQEVLGGTGLLFTCENLHNKFKEALTMDEESHLMGKQLKSRYQWDAVAAAYKNVIDSGRADYIEQLHSPFYAQINSKV